MLLSDTSRCLFSDKYKTHKYSVGRAYSCWMLNWWCITWPEDFKCLRKQAFYVTIKRRMESVKIEPDISCRSPPYTRKWQEQST